MTRVGFAMACAALLLGACAPGAPPDSTRLETLDVGRFRFTAPADAARPVADPQAEHTRRRWLDQHLAAQRLCPRGHAIDSRVALDEQRGLVRQPGVGSYRVVYEGHCIGG